MGRFIESRTDLSMRVDVESGRGEGGKTEESAEGRMERDRRLVKKKKVLLIGLGCGVVVAIVLAVTISVVVVGKRG